ncbi:uncharacterized protein [Triticum aestivum]|uniref:uncharacterized protein n=1 Tax=Triticum aestivum TaxID=4565 RepID=UPI001D01F3A7|nr:uncharacterized protein LOC123120703 [Triticum aestivum]
MAEPRRRAPGDAAPPYDAFDGLFSVEIHHKGFFCGTDNNNTYMDYEVAWFDNCDSDTWSLLWIDDFLQQLGYDRDCLKLDVYWCQPGKTLVDGLRNLTCDADILAMIAATTEHKNLLLIVDHGERLDSALRDDILLDGVPVLSKVITPGKESKGKEQYSCPEERSVPNKRRSRRLFVEGSSSGCADEELEEQDGVNAAESETDEDFYDSDYDIEDGDDDLYVKNVDKEVDDHREKDTACDYEAELAEDALDDSHLHLSNEKREKLKYHFKGFNLETDLNNPILKLGQVFGNVQELRHAITSYSIRNRVQVKKTRNTSKKIIAVCSGECPWYLMASKDNRTSSFVIKKYCDEHTCTKAWNLKGLTAPFLTRKFKDKFRDNEKMSLKKFLEKVQTEYNLIPTRTFGIVEVESTSSWEWFLESLKDDLNICNTSPYTIMSDKQKGLIKAVAKIWHDGEHRFCVRHMYQNSTSFTKVSN